MLLRVVHALATRPTLALRPRKSLHGPPKAVPDLCGRALGHAALRLK